MDEKTVKKILGIIIKADEQDWEWERMGKELDAALYSEPQVDKAYLNFEPPEKPQVCPECSGFGSITIAGCSGTKNIKCPKCNGTGNVPAQPQQPVPTEELLTDEEILDLGKKYCYQSTRPAIATWELCWMKEICQSQLLKCHQSESAEIASLQADIEELNILYRCNSEVYDTRIKEDAHTRLELAKAVREIDNPYKQPLSRFSDNTRLTMGKRKGFDEALQAVLKVMEGTK